MFPFDLIESAKEGLSMGVKCRRQSFEDLPTGLHIPHSNPGKFGVHQYHRCCISGSMV